MTLGYDYKQCSLLFVDDEEQACKYFRMAFEDEFLVVTAQSADQALALVQRAIVPVGVVMADQRMPQRPGTELLADVRREYPETVRILTTAYADLDAAVDAVNEGAIFKYVVKPWDLRELRVTLRHAMEYFLLRRERDALLREKLSSLQQILSADRVRTLAVLAEGMSAQVRAPKSALQAYVNLVKTEVGPSAPSAVDDSSMQAYMRARNWAESDSHHDLLSGAARVVGATLEARHEWNDKVPVADLIMRALGESSALASSAAPPLVHVAPELAPLECNRAMLERMFRNLLRCLERVAGPRPLGSIEVAAQHTTRISQTEAVCVELTRSGFGWDEQALALLRTPLGPFGSCDAEPEVLASFFIAHHHGGTIALHKRADGDGFSITLPFSPRRATVPAFDERAADNLFT